MKIQMFLSTALTTWDADFYVKADDNVHVNIGMQRRDPFNFDQSTIVPVHHTEIGGALSIQVSPDRFWRDTGRNLGCTLAAWNLDPLLLKSNAPYLLIFFFTFIDFIYKQGLSPFHSSWDRTSTFTHYKDISC
jgi:hypothetical protein